MRRLAAHSLAAMGSQDNAMTEVALALAMGFFSIVVLTLISMGGGEGEATAYEAVAVVRADEDSRTATQTDSGDVIVLFDGVRFLDTQLKPVDPRTVETPREGRLVLAVAPDLSFAQVSDARRRFGARELAVTTLDARWMAAVSGAARGETR